MTSTVSHAKAAADGDTAARVPLVKAQDLVQTFVARGNAGVHGGVVHALSGVSFELHRGEVLGLVGETGSGKSTLGRAVLGAPRPQSGQVLFEGRDMSTMSRRGLREVRRQMQMIYQDPFSSLDPRWKVTDIVEEPLVTYRIGTRAERRKRVAEMLELVGLDESVHGARRPRELSGGQCQRVAIARALTLSPALLVCDEAVSSLDVLIQAQVLNLFEKLRTELGLAYLFIAHDLALVKQVSDRVAVMYLGKLVELGPAEDLYRQPLHPYTGALLASIPELDPAGRRSDVDAAIHGEPPSPTDPPSGCRFRTRCPRAQALCASEEPPLREVAGHSVACHFPLTEPAPTAAGQEEPAVG